MKSSLRTLVLASGMTLIGFSAAGLWSVGHGTDAPAKDPAVGRARREVRLLDDIYKNAIVLITKHYVDEKSDLPAGEAFKVLFGTMKEKGWHEVRLLDGSGQPINDENRPSDEFEREAIRQMLAEKPYYEQVVSRDGKRYLRAATPVPVVMEKCVMCHENYKGKKIIGSLSYTLPLEVEMSSATVRD